MSHNFKTIDFTVIFVTDIFVSAISDNTFVSAIIHNTFATVPLPQYLCPQYLIPGYQLPVTAEYRMAGNSVPVPYFTKLLNAVIEYLAPARVQPAKSREMECQLVIPAKHKPSLRQRMARPSVKLAGMLAEVAKHNPVTGTTVDTSVNTADAEKSKKKTKSGNNLVHDLNDPS